MRVVCIKQTKKLVKGFEYNLSALNNSAVTASKARSGKAFIDKIGWYSVSNFQTIDGEELPKLDIIRTTFDEKDWNSLIFLRETYLYGYEIGRCFKTN